MSAGERKMNCSEVGPLLVFLACDELTVERTGGNRNAPGKLRGLPRAACRRKRVPGRSGDDSANRG